MFTKTLLFGVLAAGAIITAPVSGAQPDSAVGGKGATAGDAPTSVSAPSANGSTGTPGRPGVSGGAPPPTGYHVPLGPTAPGAQPWRNFQGRLGLQYSEDIWFREGRLVPIYAWQNFR